ncbi:MAG: DUF2243 domain-containing protein [Burkholderiales bacterium]
MTAATLLLGIGMGGFLDGIVLHQILQWHNMLSAVRPPQTMQAMQLNMTADGWFHLAMWLVTAAGVLLLRATPGPPDAWPWAFAGNLFIGWGAFNVVEGLIDHHLLELHHVRDVPTHMPAYDFAFLALGGVGFLILGVALRRKRVVAA